MIERRKLMELGCRRHDGYARLRTPKRRDGLLFLGQYQRVPQRQRFNDRDSGILQMLKVSVAVRAEDPLAVAGDGDRLLMGRYTEARGLDVAQLDFLQTEASCDPCGDRVLSAICSLAAEDAAR